ncbi:metallophosphoesterase [Cedratvirus kamchatka]|uniref:Metallophosphoesterase n=1 Tax=Cedratvirus kamchatka TaxID=2716914 RepID=A0A6G8MXJ7_9VIRU|nr:metallophosphoesterase [Cedratvirus kamchatka]
MEIQAVSDLHLEFHTTLSFLKLTPCANYLALCGDVGSPALPLYREFISWCSERWKKVFLVAGNHEYYSARETVPEIKEKIKGIVSNFPNVYFLDDQGMEVDGFRIYGTTLWSEVENKRFIRDNMNDYRRINIKENHYTKNISLQDMLDMHKVCLEKLKEEISTCAKISHTLVILSHYLPSYQCIDDKYKNNACNSAYASNLEDLIRPPVVLWLYGHSHQAKEVEINSVPCISNPLGYPGEKTGFCDHRIISVKHV